MTTVPFSQVLNFNSRENSRIDKSKRSISINMRNPNLKKDDYMIKVRVEVTIRIDRTSQEVHNRESPNLKSRGQESKNLLTSKNLMNVNGIVEEKKRGNNTKLRKKRNKQIIDLLKKRDHKDHLEEDRVTNLIDLQILILIPHNKMHGRMK